MEKKIYHVAFVLTAALSVFFWGMVLFLFDAGGPCTKGVVLFKGTPYAIVFTAIAILIQRKRRCMGSLDESF